MIMAEGGEETKRKWDGGILWRLHGMTFDTFYLGAEVYRIGPSIDR